MNPTQKRIIAENNAILLSKAQIEDVVTNFHHLEAKYLYFDKWTGKLRSTKFVYVNDTKESYSRSKTAEFFMDKVFYDAMPDSFKNLAVDETVSTKDYGMLLKAIAIFFSGVGIGIALSCML
jgi:hypothetical protein